MDFYYADLSAPCRAVLLLARYLGIQLNKKSLDMAKGEHMTPEFIAINPQHCVPTLVDGNLKLWESRAILTYLASKYGKSDSVYPSNPESRANVDKILYFDIGTLFIRFRQYFVPTLFGGKKPDPAKLELVKEALGYLNLFLEGHNFSVGDNLTVADFSLVAVVSNIDAIGIDISPYPNVSSWYQRCKTEMPGFEEENGEGAKKLANVYKSKIP